jgi:hypothetical protein
LPKRLQEARHPGCSAIIKEANAEDFSGLLRLGGWGTRQQKGWQ